jgi:hypothetical protein
MITREFDSVLKFVEHLTVLAASIHEAEHKALDEALVLLEKDMAARIGQYQDASGRFPAWAPLAESTEAEKERLGYPSDAPLLREGDLQQSFTHSTDGPREGLVGSTDDTMLYHEMGTSKMPPRPVVGPAWFDNSEKVRRLLGHAVAEAIIGGNVAEEYLLPE